MMVGLSRFEVPIDSRITKWLNDFGFPVKLAPSALPDGNSMKTKDKLGTFWLVVVDCLTAFHEWEAARARRAVKTFETSLASKVTMSAYSMIFHEEPFVLACEIAQYPMSMASHREEYEAILKKRNW
jgi:hypothetical protein